MNLKKFYHTYKEKILNMSKLENLSDFNNPITLHNEKIYGFYHIYCNNDWKKVVLDQVHKISYGDIYKYLEKIFVSVIIETEKDIEYIQNILPEKFVIVIISKDPKDYEFAILVKMQEIAFEEDFFAFYFHTKGVSLDKKVMTGIDNWLLIMEYFMFDKYNVAVNTLQRGYNAYGSLLMEHIKGEKFFNGNFWWTTSKYIKSLKRIENNGWRYSAEAWIGSSKDFKPFVPYRTSLDLYRIPLPRFFYTNDDFSYFHFIEISTAIILYIKSKILKLSKKLRGSPN